MGRLFSVPDTKVSALSEGFHLFEGNNVILIKRADFVKVGNQIVRCFFFSVEWSHRVSI